MFPLHEESSDVVQSSAVGPASGAEACTKEAVHWTFLVTNLRGDADNGVVESVNEYLIDRSALVVSLAEQEEFKEFLNDNGLKRYRVWFDKEWANLDSNAKKLVAALDVQCTKALERFLHDNFAEAAHIFLKKVFLLREQLAWSRPV